MREEGRRVEFVSDTMLYITLRSHWYNIVLNVHAPAEDKTNDTRRCFIAIAFQLCLRICH
jgi:hypothetical protein